MNERELVGPQERAAAAMYAIVQVDTHRLPPLTTAQIARLCGMTWDGAYLMLGRISRVTPLRQLRYGWTYRTCGVDAWEE